ncbi:hypothetical protein O3M35_012102 [Rhynocoris fuscipes]|uniref:Uncharacterized protein n=1 Tax=Rhynocoris fuscipes TaxID=488301 RepID=A0AAW1CR59_9HEMI
MMQIEQVSYSIGANSKKSKKPRPIRRQSLPEEQGGVKSFSILDILNHRPAKETRIVRPWDIGAESTSLPGAPRPKSAELYETCSSGRSSTGDCVSPRRPTPVQHQQQRKGKNDTSPLDALFQMTSKTFEELNGESQGKLLYFSFINQNVYNHTHTKYHLVTYNFNLNTCLEPSVTFNANIFNFF